MLFEPAGLEEQLYEVEKDEVENNKPKETLCDIWTWVAQRPANGNVAKNAWDFITWVAQYVFFILLELLSSCISSSCFHHTKTYSTGIRE
jgi:hypothetical protein